MKCSRCGAEMKIKNVKVDTDIYGNPVYNKYAYCYKCRIKRNLDKPRAAAPSGSIRQSSARRNSARRAKQRRKRKILIISALLLLLAVIAVCAFLFIRKTKADEKKAEQQTVVTDNRKNHITSKAFSELETGMTLDETKEIIGTDGNKLLQTSSDTSTTERYQWISKDGDGTVLLTFIDEKLADISQTGLDSGEAVSLPSDISGVVKTDMTYDEVVQALGGEGTRLSETVSGGITTTLYSWDDTDGNTSLSVVFTDGKVRSYQLNELEYGNKK